MARIPRIMIVGEPTAYHVIPRTALDGFPIGDVEKDFNLTRTRRFLYRTRYFTDSGIIGTKDFVRVTYNRIQEKYQVLASRLTADLFSPKYLPTSLAVRPRSRTARNMKRLTFFV